jgi:FkbM family methyltransferase
LIYSFKIQCSLSDAYFESQENAFADLKKFVRQANLEEFIECHQLALSNTEGLGHIQLPDGFHSGLGQLYPGGGVPIKKLDNLILPPPDLIKTDVESYEYTVQAPFFRICHHFVIEFSLQA